MRLANCLWDGAVWIILSKLTLLVISCQWHSCISNTPVTPVSGCVLLDYALTIYIISQTGIAKDNTTKTWSFMHINNDARSRRQSGTAYSVNLSELCLQRLAVCHRRATAKQHTNKLDNTINTNKGLDYGKSTNDKRIYGVYNGRRICWTAGETIEAVKVCRHLNWRVSCTKSESKS